MNSQSEINSACGRRPGAGSGRPERDPRAEAELISGLAARNERAITSLYQRHGKAVYAIGRTITGDRDLADLVVQQTFRRAWQTAVRFEPEADVASWLYTIARNRAVALRDRPGRPGPADRPEPDREPDLPSIREGREIGEVRAAIDALPAEEREIVRLAHREGLTYAEIARRLGLSVGVVRTRSFQAHKRLATSLRHVVQSGPEAERSPSARPGQGRKGWTPPAGSNRRPPHRRV